jgi:hypothetical protein
VKLLDDPSWHDRHENHGGAERSADRKMTRF